MMTNTDTLEQITQRIVEGFHPQRLILFGSRARGDQRRDSDESLMLKASYDLSAARAILSAGNVEFSDGSSLRALFAKQSSSRSAVDCLVAHGAPRNEGRI